MASREFRIGPQVGPREAAKASPSGCQAYVRVGRRQPQQCRTLALPHLLLSLTLLAWTGVPLAALVIPSSLMAQQAWEIEVPEDNKGQEGDGAPEFESAADVPEAEPDPEPLLPEPVDPLRVEPPSPPLPPAGIPTPPTGVNETTPAPRPVPTRGSESLPAPDTAVPTQASDSPTSLSPPANEATLPTAEETGLRPVKPEAMPAPTSAANPSAGGGKKLQIVVPEGNPSDLAKLWSARLEDLKEMDPSQAKLREAAILKLKARFGLANLPMIGQSLVREARVDLEHGQGNEALRKARLALVLAPDAPAAELFLARAILMVQPTSVGDILGALWRSMTKRWGQFPYRRVFLANLAAVFGAACFLTGALFILLTAFSRSRLILHDFHHRLPRGTTHLQSAVTALTLVALPVFLELGVVIWLVLPALMVWPYVAKTRRIILVGSLALAGVVGPFVGWSFDTARFHNTRAEAVWQLERGARWERALASVDALVEQDKARLDERLALGRAHLRLGHLERARSIFEAAISKGGAGRVDLQNNLGVTLFALSDNGAAKQAFQKAVSIDPGAAAAYHNLAKVYFKDSLLSKGQEARRQALSIDRKLVETHPDGDPQLNVSLAQIPLSDSDFAHLAALSDRKQPIAEEQIRAHLASLFPSLGSIPLTGLLLVLVLVGGLLTERLGVAMPCLRCGRPVCRRCDRESKGNTCGQCVNVFERRDVVSPAARLTKERAITRRRNLWGYIERLGAFLLPGSGQVLAESPLLGWVLMLLASCGLLSILAWSGPLPGVLAPEGGLPLWRLVLSGMLALLAWGLSIWTVFRRS